MGFSEADTATSEAIEVGGFEDRMVRYPQGICTLVVCQKKDNIGTLYGFRTTPAGRRY